MTAPIGWNTWDTQFHTGVAHLPSGLRIRVAMGTPDGLLVDNFTWRRGLERLGHHTVDGEYAEVTVRSGDALLRLVFTSPRPDLLCALAELTGAEHTVHLIVDHMPAAPGPVDAVASGQSVDRLDVTVNSTRWRLALSEPATVRSFGDGLALTLSPGTSCRFACAPEEPDLDFDLEAARERARAAAIGSAGWLGRSAEGYQRALTWNTVARTDLGRVITPTSRDFVHAARDGFYGTWALHGWDTFFCGLTATWIDHDYALGIHDQILEQVTPGGFVPNRVSDERGRTDDRSQPPVGAYTVFKSYLSTGLSDETRDRRLLTETFPVLLGWHDWWSRARRGPHNALAWGSDPTDDPKSATIDSTRRESGLDDSPMYDEIQYDPVTHTMDLADVGLNALHAADAEALAAMADRLGDHDTAARLRTELAKTRQRVEDLFWDEESGHYRNVRADGTFDVHLTPTMLYPLLAGLPSQRRAQRLVDTVLVPSLLGGSPPLPSTSRSDPGFNRFYCRGRIWGPVAFLAVEGMRRYNLDVSSIVDDLLTLFRDEWEQNGHVHENYFSDPTEDIHPFEARSDFLLSWGNLLAYLAMQELADPRPSGWRFAHPGKPATLTNLTLREGKLTITANERLRVTLDGATLVDAPPNTIIENYERSTDTVRAVVRADGPVTFGVPPSAGTEVRVGNDVMPVADDHTVTVTPPAGPLVLSA